ncbi:MAG: hypothetical protein DME98_14705 [Verrucomicrobia bacterium]|nr:MAG: hypothetical protein DME98_14705 [Verrucomicrobiota bacterium]PYJ32464.1 MAG: hypothetical protein DME88_10930 [Verrucomicrobiota bacterium]
MSLWLDWWLAFQRGFSQQRKIAESLRFICLRTKPCAKRRWGDWLLANHPEAWCLVSITLGCQSCTEAQVIAIMQNPTRGDMTYQLAAQLAAAKLNVACNLTDLSCVASAIAAADAWLCSHPIGSNVRAHSQAWKEITPTYNTLADYNNGLLCARPR